MILAGDVGGTKTNLGLFDVVGGRLVLARRDVFPSQHRPSLEAIIEEFLAAGGETVDRTAIGVAGPVVEGKSHVVNLRWPVDAHRLTVVLGHRVRLLNDL